jgi:hypothetical protein
MLFRRKTNVLSVLRSECSVVLDEGCQPRLSKIEWGTSASGGTWFTSHSRSTWRDGREFPSSFASGTWTMNYYRSNSLGFHHSRPRFLFIPDIYIYIYTPRQVPQECKAGGALCLWATQVVAGAAPQNDNMSQPTVCVTSHTKAAHQPPDVRQVHLPESHIYIHDSLLWDDAAAIHRRMHRGHVPMASASII